MKLTYPICCGIDVHKTFLVATIITSNFESPKYKQKRFSTFLQRLDWFQAMAPWQELQGCLYGKHRQVLGIRLECSGGYYATFDKLLFPSIIGNLLCCALFCLLLSRSCFRTKHLHSNTSNIFILFFVISTILVLLRYLGLFLSHLVYEKKNLYQCSILLTLP